MMPGVERNRCSAGVGGSDLFALKGARRLALDCVGRRGIKGWHNGMALRHIVKGVLQHVTEVTIAGGFNFGAEHYGTIPRPCPSDRQIPSRPSMRACLFARRRSVINLDLS